MTIPNLSRPRYLLPNRLPSRKLYTPVKPQGAKAMTIAVGFPYSDGVLVCADTQMTYSSGAKYSDHKIFPGDIEGCPCIFAFADQSGLAAEVRSKIFRKIKQFIQEGQTEITTEEVCAIVEATMNEYERLYVDLPLEFLLAIYLPKEEPAIIHFDGKSVNIKQDEVVIMGCGNDTLTRYLTDNLFVLEMEWEKAVVFGSYLVKKATQYVQHCGEPIEAICLTRGSTKEVDKKDIDWACTLAERQEVEMDKWMFKRV